MTFPASQPSGVGHTLKELKNPEAESLVRTTPEASRPDLVLETRMKSGRTTLELHREGVLIAQAERNVRGSELILQGITVERGEPARIAHHLLTLGAADEADRRGLREFLVRSPEVPHPQAERVGGSVWRVELERLRDYEERREAARELVAEAVESRFPALKEGDTAKRVELLPSKEFDERVDEMAQLAERRGGPWDAQEVTVLKSAGVRGFVKPSEGRALVRWDGAPGEISTAYHEAVHLPTAERSVESIGFEMPAALKEGYAELMAQRNAGDLDRLGPRSLTAKDGAVRTAIYVAENRWRRKSAERDSSIDIFGRQFAAREIGAGFVLVRVDGSYPAAVEAVSRILAVVDQDTFEMGLVGDASRVKELVDEYFGRGRFEALAAVMGSDPEEWYEPDRVDAVRKVLSR